MSTIYKINNDYEYDVVFSPSLAFIRNLHGISARAHIKICRNNYVLKEREKKYAFIHKQSTTSRVTYIYCKAILVSHPKLKPDSQAYVMKIEFKVLTFFFFYLEITCSSNHKFYRDTLPVKKFISSHIRSWQIITKLNLATMVHSCSQMNIIKSLDQTENHNFR